MGLALGLACVRVTSCCCHLPGRGLIWLAFLFGRGALADFQGCAVCALVPMACCPSWLLGVYPLADCILAADVHPCRFAMEEPIGSSFDLARALSLLGWAL